MADRRHLQRQFKELEKRLDGELAEMQRDPRLTAQQTNAVERKLRHGPSQDVKHHLRL